MAKVTGQLYPPQLDPCPRSSDVEQMRDDRCNSVICQRKPDWTGLDCCQYWKKTPNVWSNEVARVDQFDPEKFNYGKYRYQLFAKPSEPSGEDVVSEYQYLQPNTDIRALKQTFYVPVLPSRPGGVTEVTYPMTPETMGQPDVTTACCVPIIPCNPGYENLTSGIYPTAGQICQGFKKSAPGVFPEARVVCGDAERCRAPPQLGYKRIDICSEIEQANRPLLPPRLTAHQAPPQYLVPPANRQGSSCTGFADTFPQPRQLYAAPQVPKGAPPHYTGEFPDARCGGDMPDDLGHPQGEEEKTTTVKAVRYADRLARDYNARAETHEMWCRRLSTMYGSFGSYLLARPHRKRFLQGTRDSIKLQGNGFSWSYPKYENRFCYMLERNVRC